MTTTEISPNGIEIGRTLAPSPLGGGITYKQVEVVYYHDGTTAYGCVHCKFVGSSAAKIRVHQQAEHGQPRGGHVARTNSAVVSLAREIERLTKDLDRLTAERDGWKERAVRAEKSLNTLRRALT